MSNIGSCLCVTGCNTSQPCPYCELERGKMCETKADIKGQPRSFERSALLAHANTGKCPGCKMDIVAEVTDPTKQMPLAKPGDRPPASKEWEGSLWDLSEKGLSWSEIHKGTAYGKTWMFRLGANQWIICLLHMNLRVIGEMFKQFVIQKITTDEQQDQIFALCKKASFNVKKKKLQRSPNTLKAGQVFKRFSMVGSEAITVQEIMEDFLKVVNPVNKKGKRSKAYENCCKCIELWREVWELLHSEVSDSQEARDEMAGKVEAKGIEFVEAWIVAHKRTQGD